MIPFKHQTDIALQAYGLLKRYGMAYLAMQERTGKTLTSILVAEMSKCTNILVITKAKALKGDNDKDIVSAKGGWAGTLNLYLKVLSANQVWKTPTKTYTIVNYESLHKVSGKYDLIILDEAHSKIAAYPKPSLTWNKVYAFTKGKPVIYLSATPSAQSHSQLYHQLKLCTHSPWAKYKNFYDWFTAYGIPEVKRIGGGQQIVVYDKCKDDLIQKIKDTLFISYTRKQLGFKVEPVNVKVYVEPSPYTKKLYNTLSKNKVIPANEFIAMVGEDYIADSVMRHRVGLHQIEGGTLKISDTQSIRLGNTEKIDWIKKEYGDSDSIVIFYHFVQEEFLLKEHFKNARILQGTSYAEGVDLSMYETLIIYSMDYSTAKYSQRKARQANMARADDINVIYLLMKGAISDQVYTTVCENNKNYVDSYFINSTL